MIHLVGLPHTPFSRAAYSCAFTIKAYNLAQMLSEQGKEVTVYWNGDYPKSLPGLHVEYVSLASTQEQHRDWGEFNPQMQPNISWDPNDIRWLTFNVMAVREIKKRIQPGDIVAVMSGGAQMRVTDQFIQTHAVVEPAVGYMGIDPRTFCAFESYAWMHNRYGAYGIDDGRPFDAVIPGYVDVNDFEVADKRGDYALFLGRLTQRKGVDIAGQIARAAGIKLIVAGTGVVEKSRSFQEEDVYHSIGETSFVADEFVLGPDQATRKELMKNAAVFICPTKYIGPFETVHVEALMSGVPVIAPNYGVFTETLRPGIDGFRYSTLKQAVGAIEDCARLDSDEIRLHAERTWSREAVAPQFGQWFDRIGTVYGGRGWYDGMPNA